MESKEQIRRLKVVNKIKNGSYPYCGKHIAGRGMGKSKDDFRLG